VPPALRSSHRRNNFDQLGLLVQEEGQEKKQMKRLSWFASVIALGMGTASMLHGDRPVAYFSANDNVAQTTNGAFRDGLYLGRLAAERGIAPRVARGRWATADDQASFTAGYERGYKEVLASRAMSDKPVRQAE
jgi:hypothetical protein